MIYTSFFGNLDNILSMPNTNIVSIAGWSPERFIRLTFDNPLKFFKYSKLVPEYMWWKEWHDKNLSNEWYIEKYKETVLSKLDRSEVYKELTHNGFKNAILLCWEGRDEFCHRQIVGNWLSEKGIYVKEL